MQRLRLIDFRFSDGPASVGIQQNNLPACASILNKAQRRLLYCSEAGEESWWGTWAEMVFNVNRADPYITTPREVARLEMVNVCNRPVAVQNMFYEYLQFGNGRLPKRLCMCPGQTQVLSRNNAVTFVELTNPPQIIRMYISDPTDAGKSVLIQGLDQNDMTVYTRDLTTMITGVYVDLGSPFTDCPVQMNKLTGIQKDQTAGPVQFFQVDPVTGNQILLLTMEPSETTASYRRYYLHDLPFNCCRAGSITPTTSQVTAIAKLELIPVQVDTDYCLIQNLDALIEECKAIRYLKMDQLDAKQNAAVAHREAVRLLNGELTHYMGKDSPAVNVAPFGSARLERVHISMQ